MWRNGFKMWKMTQRFEKWPKYLGKSSDIFNTAFRSGFTMLELA